MTFAGLLASHSTEAMLAALYVFVAVGSSLGDDFKASGGLYGIFVRSYRAMLPLATHALHPSATATTVTETTAVAHTIEATGPKA